MLIWCDTKKQAVQAVQSGMGEISRQESGPRRAPTPDQLSAGKFNCSLIILLIKLYIVLIERTRVANSELLCMKHSWCV